MKKSRSVFLCLCAVASLLALASANSFGQGSNLDGVYEFTHMETPDGVQETQMGMLIIADGHICHVRTAKDREPLRFSRCWL